MAAEDSHPPQPTQKTRPRGKDKQGRRHKPADIPIPTRKEVFDLMRSVTGKRSSVSDDRRPKQ